MDAEEGPSRISQQLLDRIRAGDATALDDLIRAMDGPFRTWVRRARGQFPGVASFEMTDDISQEVWLRVVNLIRSGRSDLPADALDFDPWLAMLLARNLRWTMLDRHRQHFGRVERGQSEDGPPGDGADVDPAPRRAHLVNGLPEDDPDLWETSGPRREEREAALLMELIEKLPEDQRAIIDLKYSGEPDAAIARLLGIDRGTVGRRARAALELLGQWLREAGSTTQGPPII